MWHTISGDVMDFDFLLGLTESEAFELIQEHDCSPRITSRDGQRFMLTCDYRTNRINISVADNKVTSWHIG